MFVMFLCVDKVSCKFGGVELS